MLRRVMRIVAEGWLPEGDAGRFLLPGFALFGGALRLQEAARAGPQPFVAC